MQRRALFLQQSTNTPSFSMRTVLSYLHTKTDIQKLRCWSRYYLQLYPDISLWFVYVYRRRLREYVPNLLTKFNPVRGFIRYFHTSIDVDFPSVPNLLTKFNPVPVDFLVRAQKSDSVLLKLAEISRKRIRFLRAH